MIVCAALGLAGAGPLAAEPALEQLRTTAERSGYEQTSRHAEVLDFSRQLDAASSGVHLTRMGYSTQGRVLPLLVWGAADASPEAVRTSGGVRVYLQGNIHGGEVCGKEALLALARDLALGHHDDWRNVVLLLAPLYNPDGNERIDIGGRARQHGPFAGVGQRGNGRGYDLNRDHVKLDTPEAQALARLLRLYDPHVTVDFHTTDGTYHAYHLTYSPPLHPATDDGLVAFLRDDLLPAASRRIEARHGWHTYYYGNLPPPHQGNLAWTGLGQESGWYTFDHRPRYSNNYSGLRNRLGLLSEAYSYATFQERIDASRAFAEAVIGYVDEHARPVRELLARADEASIVGRPLALRARHARSEAPVRILGGAVREEPNPFSGGTVLRRLDVVEPVEVHEYGTFAATETVAAPRAYLVPETLTTARRLLGAHGIRTRRLAADTTVTAERFRVDSTWVADSVYEGHREGALSGAYETARITVPAGTAVVPVDQPLGRLAVLLLEPRSDDGLVAWNLLDAELAALEHYPILRLAADP